jgi:hypothetical protein
MYLSVAPLDVILVPMLILGAAALFLLRAGFCCSQIPGREARVCHGRRFARFRDFLSRGVSNNERL